MTVKELNSQLKDAIENEDYESASRLRDEINKRKKLKHLFFIKKLMISCIIILYLIALNPLNNNY